MKQLNVGWIKRSGSTIFLTVDPALRALIQPANEAIDQSP